MRRVEASYVLRSGKAHIKNMAGTESPACITNTYSLFLLFSSAKERTIYDLIPSFSLQPWHITDRITEHATEITEQLGDVV